jgi:hypothetical protein
MCGMPIKAPLLPGVAGSLVASIKWMVPRLNGDRKKMSDATLAFMSSHRPVLPWRGGLNSTERASGVQHAGLWDLCRQQGRRAYRADCLPGLGQHRNGNAQWHGQGRNRTRAKVPKGETVQNIIYVRLLDEPIPGAAFCSSSETRRRTLRHSLCIFQQSRR